MTCTNREIENFLKRLYIVKNENSSVCADIPAAPTICYSLMPERVGNTGLLTDHPVNGDIFVRTIGSDENMTIHGK